MAFRDDIYNKLDKEDKLNYGVSADTHPKRFTRKKPSDDINSSESSTPTWNYSTLYKAKKKGAK